MKTNYYDLSELIKEEFWKDTCILTNEESINWDWYDYIEIDVSWEAKEYQEYRVIPKSIIEEVFEESVKELVQDAYLWNSDLPSWITDNIDWEWIASELMVDWYWQHFNWYNWWEIEWHWIYLFRNN